MPIRPACRPSSALRWLRLLATGILLVECLIGTAHAAGTHACVWKVTDNGGHTLYLAGSVHALRANDYPFPAAYEQAYAASSSLAFETDVNPGWRGGNSLGMAARYPMYGKLKDHVDPRTYAYILRVISDAHGSTEPEKRIQYFRPWALAFMLESPDGFRGVSTKSGVEPYFIQKAGHDQKPMAGLVSRDEHIAVFDKMNDADSETVLLLAFIHLNTAGKTYDQTVANWKRGDIAGIERIVEDEYRDAPSIRQRMLTDRNQRWMPKLEGYLRSGKTWMAIVGTAHMAGDHGLPALLSAKGYRVEQL